MGQRRTLSGWLTNRYLLIIRNEENFAEKRTIRFNYARIILILTIFFLAVLSLSVYLVSSALEKWLDPRHTQMVANRQVIELSMKIDSLENETTAQLRYINNIKDILDGKPVGFDSVYDDRLSDRQFAGEVLLPQRMDPTDSQFRADFEKTDLGLSSILINEGDDLRDIFLFPPVEGIVSGGFEPKSDHYGLDIVSNENEPIKAVADGVVIFSGWTLDGGYVIAIQHRGDLISVYKHNSELLKNVGNFVLSGGIIAIIGNTGELTSGPHLHVELWHKGNPLNPEDFISF